VPKLTFEQFQATGVAVPDIGAVIGDDGDPLGKAGRVYDHPEGDAPQSIYIEEHAPGPDGWYVLCYNADLLGTQAACERFLYDHI
jgi:hypothetical protein